MKRSKMFRSSSITIALCLLAFSLCAQESIYEDAGSSGMVFLKIGVGARSSGLAGAYSAVADNSMAVFWNPGRLASLEGTDISFSHSEYVEDIRYDAVSIAMRTDIGTFGLGGGAFYADDLELREKPGDPEGLFRFDDYLLSLSYSRSVSPESDLGVTVKFLQERIYKYTTSGYALDVGAVFKPKAVTNLVLSGAVQNLGPKFAYADVPFRLPMTFRAGASYRLPAELLDGSWLVSAEGAKAADADYEYSGGMEYSHGSGLALRAGYKFGHVNESFSAGAGFTAGHLRLDYSYTPWDYVVGAEHWMSVGVNF
jgi:hypothetical protein